MKERILFITSILIFAISITYGQYFIPGYIVDNNGDSISGLIRFQKDVLNSEKCVFKLDEDQNPTIYSPRDLAEFKYYDGKYYKSKEIIYDGRNYSIFAEFLVDGVVDLYSIWIENDEKFMYETEEDTIVISKSETSSNSSGKTFENSYKSKGIIKYLMNDAPPEISQQIDEMYINQHSLIDLTKDYHTKVCTDYDCVTFSKQKSLAKTYFGAYAGTAIGILKQRKTKNLDIFDYINQGESTTSISPLVGVDFSAVFPMIHHRLIFDLFFEHSSFKSEIKFKNSNATAISEVDFSQIGFGGHIGFALFNKIDFQLVPIAGYSRRSLWHYNCTIDLDFLGDETLASFEPENWKYGCFNVGIRAQYSVKDNLQMNISTLYERKFTRNDKSQPLNNIHILYASIGIKYLIEY